MQIGTAGAVILQKLYRDPKKMYMILTITAELDQIEHHFKAVLHSRLCIFLVAYQHSEKEFFMDALSYLALNYLVNCNQLAIIHLRIAEH